MPMNASGRFEEDTRRAFAKGSPPPVKPVKPVVPPEREGKSTKLADLPHGLPSFGFLSAEEQHRKLLLDVMYKISEQLEVILNNTTPVVYASPPETHPVDKRHPGARAIDED